jgi:hypothetical protein
MRRRVLMFAALAAACGGSGRPTPGSDDADGSPGSGGADAAPSGDGSVAVSVAGNAEWTQADMTVERGELLRVTAGGTIMFDGDNEAGPGGFGPDDFDPFNAVPCADHAALIARVDEAGGAFLVGGEQLLLAPRSGPLAFGPNDSSTSDNDGAFTVAVEPQQPVEIVEQRSVTVAGDATWIDSGIDLVPDRVIAIDGDGRVDNNIPGGDTGPEGLPDSAGDPYNVLACANHMSLIGRIGVDGEPFAIGRDRSLRAAESGRLFLRVNHTVPGGNTGKFSAGILVASPR